MNDAVTNLRACHFKTKRLEIEHWRPLLDDDRHNALTAELYVLLTPAVLKHLPDPLQLSQTRDQIEEWTKARDRESDVFCIRDREKGIFHGLLILSAADEPDGGLTVRLGYLLVEAFWGQGIASELVAGLVDWCQAQHQPMTLLGGVEKTNPASAKALVKAGFTRAEDFSNNTTDTFQLALNPDN